jgi:hypothetical protein
MLTGEHARQRSAPERRRSKMKAKELGTKAATLVLTALAFGACTQPGDGSDDSSMHDALQTSEHDKALEKRTASSALDVIKIEIHNHNVSNNAAAAADADAEADAEAEVSDKKPKKPPKQDHHAHHGADGGAPAAKDAGAPPSAMDHGGAASSTESDAGAPSSSPGDARTDGDDGWMLLPR